MVVYLDVLVIENIIINTFLLYITSQTLLKKTNFKWIVLSGSLGGVYASFMVFPRLRLFTSMLFKIAAAAFMIFIAFRNKKIMFIIKATVVLILYSMTLAGVCVFIEFYKNDNTNFSVILENVPYEYILISIMVLYMFISRIIIFIKDRREVFNLIYKVEIGTSNSKNYVRAFFDTGNELREPVTNLPVMIVERASLKNVKINEKLKYYIQYRVVDGKVGKLEAFKPVYVKIYRNNEIEDVDMLIALSDDKLSNFNDYTALLPRGCI